MKRSFKKLCSFGGGCTSALRNLKKAFLAKAYKQFPIAGI
jgi:hypothetical protein